MSPHDISECYIQEVEDWPDVLTDSYVFNLFDSKCVVVHFHLKLLLCFRGTGAKDVG